MCIPEFFKKGKPLVQVTYYVANPVPTRVENCNPLAGGTQNRGNPGAYGGGKAK